MPPTRSAVAVVDAAEVLVRVRHPPEHVVGGMQQDGRVEGLAELGRDGDVVVVAVRADHRDDVAAADGLDDRARLVRGVEHDDVGVVTDQPDVVVDFPAAAVEFERSVGDHALDGTAVHQDHHGPQDLAGVHLVEGVLDAVEADAFGDELLQRQPALQIEADQSGEVALGQAVAVPGRLQRSASGEEVDQRHLEGHVRRRNTDQHNRSGQVAGVERLLPGLGTADRVDHHVGAVAVGQVLDGLDDVELAWR